MSMLDFVKRAFGEGGAQLEVLSNLLECKELPAEMSLEEKFHLALAEVLRLRNQVQTLQQQVSAIVREKERMNLLIWTELSRLGNKLEGGSASDASPSESRTLLEEGKCDPVLQAILGSSSTEEASPTEGSLLSPTRSNFKRHRSALDAENCAIRSPRHFMGETGSKAEPGEHTSSDANSRRNNDVPTEQRFLINAWIQKQRLGFARNSGSPPNESPWSLNGSWFCYVCGTESKEAPGDHFCVGKYDAGHREGLKVFCQYCRKGTARMPDLRVHFKKIVYCRVLREELKRMIIHCEDSAAATEEEENSSPPPRGNGVMKEDDSAVMTDEDVDNGMEEEQPEE